MTFLRSRICIACVAVALAQPRTLSDLKSPAAVKAALKTLSEIMQTPKDPFRRLKSPAAVKAASYTTHPETSACFQDVHLHIKKGVASLLQDHNVPGAGVDKFKPFEKVLKDGFLAVECVKDNMYYNGDKFGDNKHDYKLGFPSVSIVHFDAFVAKEDQGEMTQKKCFEFCRTVPNMGFFGIVNGRQCYCTPYYTAMESDSSQCDAFCEGDQTTICGGESKSSVFAMHMCDSTKMDLGKLSGEAKYTASAMGDVVKLAKSLSAEMQDMAAQLQPRFGAVGDSSATTLLQNAKVFAGELVHKAEDADEAANALGSLSESADSLKDFGSPATVTKAERLMEDIDEALAKVYDVHDELATLEALAKGEHHLRDPLQRQFKTSSVEVKVKGGSAGKDAGGHEKIGKADYYSPGPWTIFCGPGQGYQGCTQEKCSPMSQKAGCRGHYEVWLHGGKLNPYNFPPGTSFCVCANVDFDESKMEKFGWGWHSQAYSYPVPVKLPKTSDNYYPVMYFVDKAFQEMPTTCTGTLVAKPIVGQSVDACAASCDQHIHSCVAFQYFKDGKKTMCFLLSKFSTGVYYTGCGKSFLQSGAAPFEAKCYAKLSKFVGTTLKPNPSGTCEQCFTHLTKADRCYK